MLLITNVRMPRTGTTAVCLLFVMCSVSAFSASFASLSIQSSASTRVSDSKLWSMCLPLFSSATNTGALENDDSFHFAGDLPPIEKDTDSSVSPASSSEFLATYFLHAASYEEEGRGEEPDTPLPYSEAQEYARSYPTPTAATTTMQSPAIRKRLLSSSSSGKNVLAVAKQSPTSGQPTLALSPQPSLTSSPAGSSPNTRPSSSIYPNCHVSHAHWIGDGWCDQGLGYNSAACGFDGGDCCVETCASSAFPCGIAGYHCTNGDVSAAESIPLSILLVASNISQSDESGQENGASQDSIGTRLQTLFTATLSSYLSLDVDIRNFSLNATPNHPEKMVSSLSSFRTVDVVDTSISNWTVLLNLSAASIDSSTVDFLSNCASSGDLEKAARLMATRLQWSAFAHLTVCSPQNSSDCIAALSTPLNTTASVDTGEYACRHSAGWTMWYGRPTQLPASLVLCFTMLVAWTALLPLPALTLQRHKATVYQALAAMGQTLSVALRLGYHLFIVVEALQPGHMDDVACIELTFLDSDGDPSYTLLQSLFYLALLSSVAWDLAGKAEALRRWRVVWAVILLAVLGLLVWQCTLTAVHIWDDVSQWPGLQKAREVSQFVVGSLLVALAGVYMTLPRTTSAPTMHTSVATGVALVGGVTIATAFRSVMDTPAAAFWVYTLSARILEGTCIVLLCMSARRPSPPPPPRPKTLSPLAGPASRNAHPARRESLSEAKKDGDGDGDEEDTRAMLPRSARPVSPLSLSPVSFATAPDGRGAHSDVESRASEKPPSIRFSDRIHAGPELPSWVRRWTEPRNRARAQSLFTVPPPTQPPLREARDLAAYSPVNQHLPPLRIPRGEEVWDREEDGRVGDGEGLGQGLAAGVDGEDTVSVPPLAERTSQRTRASHHASARKRQRG